MKKFNKRANIGIYIFIIIIIAVLIYIFNTIYFLKSDINNDNILLNDYSDNIQVDKTMINTNVISKCSDGTLNNTCSNNKPFFALMINL